MVENQSVFRRHNEQVQKDMAQVHGMMETDGYSSAVSYDEMPLHFFCECSDEHCEIRIEMHPANYRRIHRNRKRFIIKPGHEVPSIEKVVERSDDYIVVEKFIGPAGDVDELQLTPVKNV